ncbi:hypothetical protein [Methylobacterium indicum]|uniref:hypothetical protein n=1 Tax=Methylobacterium indicum TaxID=1775910 RepID=UPI001A92C2FA|nr:hypothetical protein [Methylobacterium indicum]
MTSRRSTAPARPVTRAAAAILLCLLAWGTGTASCWSKHASQPPLHARPEAG